MPAHHQSHGKVQQITLLAAVHLTRADGRLLVQLGQVRDGSIEITGVLPGRRLQGDRVGGALQRDLGGQLAPLSGGIQIDHPENHVEYEWSHKPRIKTKYVRHALLAGLEYGYEDRFERIQKC